MCSWEEDEYRTLWGYAPTYRLFLRTQLKEARVNLREIFGNTDHEKSIIASQLHEPEWRIRRNPKSTRTVAAQLRWSIGGMLGFRGGVFCHEVE